MTLFLLPLEPISMRYGEQWLKWFGERTNARNIDTVVIEGDKMHDTDDTIQTGQFLDAHKTNYWKLTQLARVVEHMYKGNIKSGDKIFDFDLWHTGLQAIPYITTLTKQNIEIYGIWHAGTYDPSDYISKEGMGVWGEEFEQSVMNFVKMGFVGSTHHAVTLTESCPARIKVTGLPLKQKDIIGKRDVRKKEKLVVNTSRLSEDKNPHMYKFIKDQVLSHDPDVKFIETHKLNLDKEDYYDILARAAIVLSTAEHENFGIGIIEGMTLNCTPVVPNHLSYTDYVPADFRYNNVEEAVTMVLNNLERFKPRNYAHEVSKYNYSIDGMLDAMGYKSDYV